jgi:ribose transport system substrate-binding protein
MKSRWITASPWRWTGAVLGAAALCGSVAGCGSNASAGGKPTVGVTVATAANAFYLAEVKGVKAAAKKSGYAVSAQYAKGDVDVQSSQIDAFIQQKVKFIVVDAADSEGIAPAVLRAQQAHIPVVAIDVLASGADATVETDNVAAGRMVCDYLIKHMKGKQFAIADSIAISVISDRIKGCKEAVESSGVQLVSAQRADNSRDGGLQVGSDVLSAHPNLGAMFGVNDPQAAGIELAAQQKGNSTLVTGGVDGSAEAVDRIKAGNQLLTTAAQDPVGLGERGFELGHDIVAGKKVSKAPIKLTPKLVTKDNVATYTPWG